MSHQSANAVALNSLSLIARASSVAEIEAEQALVNANRELIERL